MRHACLTRKFTLSILALLSAAGCSQERGPSSEDQPALGGDERVMAEPRRDAAGEQPGDAGAPPTNPIDAGADRDAPIPTLADAGGRAPPRPDAAPPPPPYDDVWEPHDLSSVDAYAIPSSAKIFAGQHPSYGMIPETVAGATSNRTIRVPIDVYLIDSAIWTEPAQLLPYFGLVRDYFGQARIDLRFTFREGPAPAWEEAPDQLHLYFTEAMMNPGGAIPDGFGNLPAGKAVLNDQLMDRPRVHRNPLFLPGKPIGHEIGHVLGLPHVNSRNFLMAQGTSARNELDLTAEESVTMRIMALHRFGGELLEE